MLRLLRSDGGPIALMRPAQERRADLEIDVRTIVSAVRADGDAALFEFTRRFDRVGLSKLSVGADERASGLASVSAGTWDDLRQAHGNLSSFHAAQASPALRVETSRGVVCERRAVPIERVGIYVPGGSAPLPSTLLMIGVPSQLAGCQLRVACTPPRADGTVDPHILAAAELCGIEHIFKVGGAQAIAAMAFGTESIPSVDKVFGPGNAWVTEAKLQVASDPQGAAFDLPAGPSEVLVIADREADTGFVAADLLSQAEHAPDAQVVLVTTSDELYRSVLKELEQRLPTLPREDVARASLGNSVAVLVPDLESALAVSNDYGPEHLILQVSEPRRWVELVRHAGSVFLGPWSPESVGDYASGTNHVLPTYGFARAWSGLGLEAFQRQITFQELSEVGIQELGPLVRRLSDLEGLRAHGDAVRVRLERLATLGKRGAS